MLIYVDNKVNYVLLLYLYISKTRVCLPEIVIKFDYETKYGIF